MTAGNCSVHVGAAGALLTQQPWCSTALVHPRQKQQQLAHSRSPQSHSLTPPLLSSSPASWPPRSMKHTARHPQLSWLSDLRPAPSLSSRSLICSPLTRFEYPALQLDVDFDLPPSQPQRSACQKSDRGVTSKPPLSFVRPLGYLTLARLPACTRHPSGGRGFALLCLRRVVLRKQSAVLPYPQQFHRTCP